MMSKKMKVMSMILISLMLNVTIFNISAKASPITEKEKKLAEKVKSNIFKLGVGKQSKVEVKLKNGKKIKGYISEVNNEYFTVIDEISGQPAQIPYPQTKQVKGNNLSTGVKIAIGLGIALGLLILFATVSSDH